MPQVVKALTVCQPYAELIASGVKPIENRTWPTRYRGLLLVHAGKSRKWFDVDQNPDDFVLGAIVAVATLVTTRQKIGLRHLELDRWGRHRALYDHEHAHGPWCWVLEDVVRLTTPVPCRGAQGLWVPDEPIAAAVLKQLGRGAVHGE